MEAMKAIFERRSIRVFEQKPIAEKDLREIIRAGAFAATGGNRQKWRFVGVLDAEKAAATTATLGWLNDWEPGEGQGPTAHAVILAPADVSTSALGDCAAAAQNMMLAAYDMGIGSCWFGSVKRERLAEVLGIPSEWQIFAVIALGYPGEEAGVVEGDDVKVKREGSGKVLVPKKPLESIMSLDGF